jgi:hypothetical protein
MAVIDDDLLEGWLHQAGEAFAVPADGAEDILRRAAATESGGSGGSAGWGPASGPTQITFPMGDGPLGDGETPARRSRPWRRTIGDHRLLAVAASVVVLAALAGGALLLGSTSAKTPQQSVAALPGATHPPAKEGGAPAPATTTIPNLRLGAAAPPPSASGSSGAGATAGSTGTSSKGAATQPGFSATAPKTAAPGQSPSNSALPSGSVGQPARIEQTGSLDLRVAKGALSKTMTKLTFLAGAYNGFVTNSQTQSSATAADGAPSGSVTLQVPVASFAAVLKSAQALGHTSDLTTKATDVTGQYVDLQARITALQSSRQAYLTILAKATTIGDILAVQAQLDNLQTQLEQLQGQLQVLGSETDYSTLNVLVSEGVTHHRPPPPPHRQSGLAKAWHDSVHGFIDGAEGIVRGAGPVLFALLCLGVLLVAGRLGWRRLQRHRL